MTYVDEGQFKEVCDRSRRDHRAAVQRLDDGFVIALSVIAAGWFAWAPSWLSFLGGCAVWLVAFGVWWQGDKEQH